MHIIVYTSLSLSIYIYIHIYIYICVGDQIGRFVGWETAT